MQSSGLKISPEFCLTAGTLAQPSSPPCDKRGIDGESTQNRRDINAAISANFRKSGPLPKPLVAVVIHFVGAGDGHANVGSLSVGELCELDAKGVQVQAGNLLIEVLGEHVHAHRVVLGAKV